MKHTIHLLTALLLVPLDAPAQQAPTVLTAGLVGDGTHDDTAAIQAQATYFSVPNLSDTRFDEDELLGGKTIRGSESSKAATKIATDKRKEWT